MITRILAIVLIGAAGLAQENQAKQPDEGTTHVERRPNLAANSDARRFLFTLSELENGRRLNSRNFEMLVREDRSSEMKTGSRVPVMGTVRAGDGSSSQGLQYLDVGLNVRAQYKLREDGKLDLNSQVEMSSIATGSGSEATMRTPPVLRQERLDVSTTVAPDTPTVIDRIEDLASGHVYELSVVARAK